jgi:hypothetical protein
MHDGGKASTQAGWKATATHGCSTIATTKMPEKWPPRICAVLTNRTVDAASAAIRQAESCADLLELRLDYLQDFDFRNVDRLRPILESRSIPAIITCRAPSEGASNRSKIQLDFVS